MPVLADPLLKKDAVAILPKSIKFKVMKKGTPTMERYIASSVLVDRSQIEGLLPNGFGVYGGWFRGMFVLIANPRPIPGRDLIEVSMFHSKSKKSMVVTADMHGNIVLKEGGEGDSIFNFEIGNLAVRDAHMNFDKLKGKTLDIKVLKFLRPFKDFSMPVKNGKRGPSFFGGLLACFLLHDLKNLISLIWKDVDTWKGGSVKPAIEADPLEQESRLVELKIVSQGAEVMRKCVTSTVFVERGAFEAKLSKHHVFGGTWEDFLILMADRKNAKGRNYVELCAFCTRKGMMIGSNNGAVCSMQDSTELVDRTAFSLKIGEHTWHEARLDGDALKGLFLPVTVAKKLHPFIPLPTDKDKKYIGGCLHGIISNDLKKLHEALRAKGQLPAQPKAKKMVDSVDDANDVEGKEEEAPRPQPQKETDVANDVTNDVTNDVEPKPAGGPAAKSFSKQQEQANDVEPKPAGAPAAKSFSKQQEQVEGQHQEEDGDSSSDSSSDEDGSSTASEDRVLEITNEEIQEIHEIIRSSTKNTRKEPERSIRTKKRSTQKKAGRRKTSGYDVDVRLQALQKPTMLELFRLHSLGNLTYDEFRRARKALFHFMKETTNSTLGMSLLLSHEIGDLENAVKDLPM